MRCICKNVLSHKFTSQNDVRDVCGQQPDLQGLIRMQDPNFCVPFGEFCNIFVPLGKHQNINCILYHQNQFLIANVSEGHYV